MPTREARLQRARLLAHRVRTIRREHGVTQVELARTTQLSLRTIKMWERGRVGSPRLTSLRALADFAGKPVSHFTSVSSTGPKLSLAHEGQVARTPR